MRYIIIVGLAVALAVVSAASAAQPLRTGIVDWNFGADGSDRSLLQARTAGATMVRLVLYWKVVAPNQPADPENPDDPAYGWASIDEQVINASQGGLDPIVSVSGAPPWARGEVVDLPGTWPSAARYGEFARAAARRYSGSFVPTGSTVPLPRVHYWQAWNEPNAGRELTPQRVKGRPASPAHYRRMVNAFAEAVHDTNPENLVVAGTLAPFGHDSKNIQVVAPLKFMSDLLCVSPQAPHRKTCSQVARFDIWAHNPYTNGGPNAHAHSPSDASIGDLPEMRSMLLAAKRNGNVVSVRPLEFWVTEFSWDTNPPDPKGVPAALHARWVSEALYRMWEAGVSAVIWFRLQDDPLRQTPYQSGFFTVSGRAKYSLKAFRFPFVALEDDSGVSIWGRTPSGQPVSVILERRAGNRWTTVTRIRANQYGIFSLRLPASTPETSVFRARLSSGSESSLPFSLAVPRGHRTTPFGCGGTIPCS
jgi:hypothetical protein